MNAEAAFSMLTVKQVAKYLGVSLGAVYALCAQGLLSHFRVGTGRGAIRIALEDLRAYLDRRRYAAKARLETEGEPQSLSQKLKQAAFRPFRHIRLPPGTNHEE